MRYAEGPRRTADGATLWLRAWEPDGRARGAGLLVHGLGEHSGRYCHVGERFVAASLGLFAFDLRGHGRSSGRRGDMRFDRALDDMDCRLADAGAEGAPAFLFGHSLGALLVLTYLVRRRPAVRAAVLSAPPLRNALREHRLKVSLSSALGRLLPALTLPSGLDVNGISRDPGVVAAYLRDPLVHDRASLGFARDANAAIDSIERDPAVPEVPVLLLHGGADPIAYAEGSRRLAARLGAAATLRVYDGLRHEPHNEPDRDAVLDDVVAWLSARLPAGTI